MEIIKLGAVFNVIRNGASISQTPGKSGIPITRIETIVDNKLDFSRVGFADVFDNRYEDFYLVNGDILMSHINSVTHLGKVGIVENINIDVIHGMNLLLLKAGSHQAFPKYLYYYFITAEFKRKLIPITKKSVNQASFNISDLKEIEIPLPSYADQIRIAHLLEKIEGLIAERKKSIELLEELVKATFYQLFGDPVMNEKGWELFNGVEYANDIQVGVVIKPASYYVDEGVIALRSLNIKPNKIDLNDVVYFPETANETTLSKSKLKKNDIVLVRTGNTGVAAIVPEELDGVNCIDLIICRPKEQLVNSFYLVYLYNSDRFQKVVENNKVGGVHKHLNVGVLKSINVPVPPIDLQNQFAVIAQKIETLKTEQEVQVQVMEELYAALSQKVFAGELDLSKIPVEETLLPKDTIIAQPEIEEDAGEEEEQADDASLIIEKEKTPKSQKGKASQTKIPKEVTKPSYPLSWDTVSFKEVATYIDQHFGAHYFNTEMLLRYLEEERGILVHYFTSAEQKKNLQYEQADDFLSFVSGALTGQNTFLQLEQVFYNAETENIPGISFTPTDLETLTGKTKKERSGIYFRIKNEITPG